MSARPWPAAVDDLLDAPGQMIEPIGPDRWGVGSRRVTRLADTGTRIDHRDLLGRLAEVAPFAVASVIGGAGEWLVTDGPVGVAADRPDLHPEPGTLAERIGEGLSALHALPVGEVAGYRPDDPWQPIVERCRARVAAGVVEPDDLPEPYARYPAERLLEMLTDGAAGGPGPADDEPVLCHGWPEAGRVLVEGGRFVGFDGLETALVADRHLDLAVAHVSVAEVLGAEAVYGFYEGYGADPDLSRLDRGVLARHLLAPGGNR